MDTNRLNQAVNQAARNRISDLPPEIVESVRGKLPFANGLRMDIAQRKFTNSRFSGITKFQARLVAGMDLLRSKAPRMSSVLIEHSAPGGQLARIGIRYDTDSDKFLMACSSWNWVFKTPEEIIEYLLPLVTKIETSGGSLTIELPVGFIPFKYTWPGFELQGEARLFV